MNLEGVEEDKRAELETAMARYGAAPRELDDELIRMSRGSRGCLGDALSASGAVLTFVIGIMAVVGIAPASVAIVGLGVMISGLFIGGRAQNQNGKLRKAALEGGPVVWGHLLDVEAHIRKPGRRVARGVVLFSVNPELKHEAARLDEIARRITGEGRDATRPDMAPVRHLINDPTGTGVFAVPDDIGPDLHVADIIVYPERLPGGRWTGAQPAFALIVDVSRSFVEQVPVPAGSLKAAPGGVLEPWFEDEKQRRRGSEDEGEG